MAFVPIPSALRRRCARFWLLVLTAGAVAAAGSSSKAAPSGFRGDGSGRFLDAEPPLRISPTENVAWSTAMPSWGNAMPALAGDRLYVTAEPTTILCLAASDGRVLWRHDVTYLDTLSPLEGPAARKEMAEAQALGSDIAAIEREIGDLRRNARKKGVDATARARLEQLTAQVTGMRERWARSAKFRPPEEIAVIGNASATPVADGDSVYAVFGNFVVARLSKEGKIQWARYLPPDHEMQMRGFTAGRAASPLLAGGTLIVPLNKLYGLDAATGRTRWIGRDYTDYGTPALVRLGETLVVLTPGGEAVRASDGLLLAERLADVTYYVGPTVGDGIAVFAGNLEASGDNRARATVVNLPERAAPFVTRRLWSAPLRSKRHYATPLVARGRLYIVDEAGELTVFDVRTGRIIGSRTLSGSAHKVFSSPTLAGDNVYLGSEEGTMWVIDAKPPFAEIARTTLDPFRASPILSGRRLYLRTLERVYCFEDKQH